MILTSVPAGTMLRDAVAQVHAKALEHGEAFEFDFNGRKIVVQPAHTLAQAQDEAHHILFAQSEPPARSTHEALVKVRSVSLYEGGLSVEPQDHPSYGPDSKPLRHDFMVFGDGCGRDGCYPKAQFSFKGLDLEVRPGDFLRIRLDVIPGRDMPHEDVPF